MKLDKFDLIALINETINEVLDFNNIEGYSYHYYGDSNKLIGAFNVDDNTVIQVFQQQISINMVKIPQTFRKEDGVINLIYSVNDVTTQHKKTSLSELLNIIKTVNCIIKEYLDSFNNKNPIFVIYSEPKLGVGLNDNQKRELYKMVLEKHLPPNYRVSDGVFNGNIPITVFQKIIKK